MDEPSGILILGIGNPARGDDGLGPAIIDLFEQAGFSGVEARTDYQLQVEEAMEIGRYGRVVFVDASRSAEPPFQYFQLPEQSDPKALDTHDVSPEALIHLARTLFSATTPASVLAIRGYDFTPFSERLSIAAEENLRLAFQYLTHRLRLS